MIFCSFLHSTFSRVPIIRQLIHRLLPLLLQFENIRQIFGRFWENYFDTSLNVASPSAAPCIRRGNREARQNPLAYFWCTRRWEATSETTGQSSLPWLSRKRCRGSCPLNTCKDHTARRCENLWIFVRSKRNKRINNEH